MPGANWQALYRDALLENDPSKLNRRIEAAKRAIHERLQEIEDSGLDTRERPQLENALHALFTLPSRKRSAS
jgi:hypothetical protein